MSPDRWHRVKQVLETALELSGEERISYVERECQGDTELQSEIEGLISSYEAAEDPLEASAISSGAAVVMGRLDQSVVGRRIGPYRVEEEIARGGMGTVYRAVRVDGHFRSQVAIKLIKRGLGDEFIIRRFRHERQIMASLEHPNIGRLLDGGSTEDGVPYFVMEYIEGRPIDRFCDENRLTIRERLELFRDVCSAVQYAHDQLVVHRDIKPSNILITDDGVPKLLDFGIAKLLNPEMSTHGGTVTAVRLMTPEYASPEQVQGEPVTVASDIYSLGVLLYELLTGKRPYRLRTSSPHELARAICDVDPERPSTVVDRRNGTAPAELSAARRTQPDKLRRALRGDLDNIVLTAMRKEPQRRYASVEQLSEDVRRHLAGFPITARKDTFGYRFAKFVERNRTPVSVSLAALLLFGGIFAVGRSNNMPAETPRIVPFTSFPGDESQPSFSPDGKKIAFVWSGDGDNQDIYLSSIDGRGMVRITTDPAQDNGPAFSPDGRSLAFLRSSHKEVALFVSAAAPRALHRKVADVFPSRVEAAGVEAVGRPVVWSPDGKYLAIGDRISASEPFSIFLIDVQTGSRTRITYPPARTIGDSNPAFSPDGRTISFIRAPSSGVSDVWVMPLDGGAAQRVTFNNRDTLTQVWSPDGRFIVFSSNRTGAYNLWRVPAAGGTPERLNGIGLGASDPWYSQDGKTLAFTQFFLDTNIWRVDAAGREKPRPLIVSTQYDSSPQFSPDGKRIAFRSSRSGAHEIWVAGADGLGAEQLTRFAGPLTGTPRWSPDGKRIAFDSRPEGQADIWVIDSRGGAPRRVTTDTSEDVVASWSRDGNWLYFASHRTGAWQSFRISPEGGAAEQVTKLGGFAGFESPDGKHLYYAKGRSVPGLWRIDLATRREEPVLEQLKAGFWGYWAIADKGIYFVDQQPEGTGRGIYFFDLATRAVRKVIDLDKKPIIGDSALALSPDGRTLLYSQIDQSGSDIMLAEYGK
ncbi:MAG TPA: protein kinase [Bryobacteraceae bacterium]|nr:protein kinase [Bryobacteraceae bacterium]